VLENFFLSQELNRQGIRTRTLHGANRIEMRMFPEGACSLAKGWAKAFSRGAPEVDPRVLFLSVAWITGMFSVVALGFQSPLACAGVYLLLASQLHYFLEKLGNYSWWLALFYPIPLLFFTSLFFASAVARGAGVSFRWRGRVIPS